MNTTEQTWSEFAPIWSAARQVLGGAVGPVMAPSREHILCEEFASRHPDSADFLVRHLHDPDPYLAAYAFKCLIRVRDLRPEHVPEDVLARAEQISVLQFGCRVRQQSLGDFFREYWHETDVA